MSSPSQFDAAHDDAAGTSDFDHLSSIDSLQSLADSTATKSAAPSPIVLWSLRLLCAVALSISGYLAWVALNASEVFGCTGDVFDCGHVLSSAWSKWFSVPVSVPAFALYASLLAVLSFVGPGTPSALRGYAWNALIAGAAAIATSAIWFIGLQVFVIKHLCPYCLAAHTCGLLFAGIVFLKNPIGGRSLTQYAGLGLTGAFVLIGGQIMTPPPQTFVVETFEDSAPSDRKSDGMDFDAPVADDDHLFAAPGAAIASSDDVDDVFSPPDVFAPPGISEMTAADDSAGEADTERGPQPGTDRNSKTESVSKSSDNTAPAVSSLLLILPRQFWTFSRVLFDEGAATNSDEASQNETQDVEKEAAPEPRIVSVAGNKFRLNAAHWPMIGKPDAKYIMVEMFDYTCPHCRNTHRTIKDACRKYGDDFSVIALAVPLNPACNSAVRSGNNPDSCELARLAIGVWRIRPDLFAEYHDWMFSAGRNRTASEARQKAEQLVGKEALAKEFSLKVPSAYIKRHVELYQKVGSGAVPKLLFPSQIMTGEVGSLTALSSAIERN